MNRTFEWRGTVTAVTSVRQYASAAVLELRLPQGLLPRVSNDSRPATCFPTFNLTAAAAPTLGFATQNRIFGNVVSGVGFGGHPNSIQGGTPLMLFDSASLHAANDTGVAINALVVSPLGNFKTALQTVAPASGSPCDGRWAGGMNGLLESLPPGFRQQTLLVAGSGLHSTLEAWGAFLLRTSGKKPAWTVADPTVDQLSYWTGCMTPKIKRTRRKE